MTTLAEADETHIPTVKKIIKEIDESEYEYLPKTLIAPFSEYPRVTYTYKFDDLDWDALVARCFSQGIYIWVFNSGHDEMPGNKLVKEDKDE